MFHVVEFIESKSVAVVPSNWMTQPGICAWPQVDAVKLAKRRRMPERNWRPFVVRILGSFRTYEEARAHLKKAEETSDLQSEEGEEDVKTKANLLLSDFEDESQSLLPPGPTLPTHPNLFTTKQKTLTPQILPSESPTLIHNVYTVPASPHIQYQNTGSKQQRYYSAPLQKTLNLPHHLNHTSSLQTQLPSQLDTQFLEQSLSSQEQKTQHDCSCSKLHLELLQAVKNEVCAHTEVLKRHNETIEKHTLLLTRFLEHQQVTGTSIDSAEISASAENCPVPLPATNINDLELLERHLKDKENFSLMVTYFASFGGNTIKRIFQRIMLNLLEHELCLSLNWMGRGGKHPFKRYVHIHGIIYRAAKCNAKEKTSLTLDEIEKMIKDWLRFAPDRCGGRKLRAQVSNAQVSNEE